MKIGFIGLGKLGGPCSEAMNDFDGVEVTGYDIVHKDLDILVSTNIKDSIVDKDLVFIAVPTPHDPEYGGEKPTLNLPPKDFSYTYVRDVLVNIKHYLTDKQTVVLISTCLPGNVRELRKHIPDNIDFIYNPYTIAMGTVKEDFLNPEFLIIGTEAKPNKGSDKLVEFYDHIIPNSIKHVVTWEEAECIKVFYNTFLSFKLSFVNMIQDVAMKIGHSDVDNITRALCDANRRLLSPSYMQAGMGDGGSCHPRDNIALKYLSKELELGYDLFGEIMNSREKQAQNMAEFLVGFDNDVVILGKSYKPCVDINDGSYALLVGHYIEDMEYNVWYEDDVVEDEIYTYLLSHPYEYWTDYDFKPGSIVVDPWRNCENIDGCKVVYYGKNKTGI